MRRRSPAALHVGGATSRLRRSAPSGRLSETLGSWQYLVLLALWAVTLFEPHQWLAAHGVSALLKIQVVLFGLLGVAVGFGVLGSSTLQRRWTWHAPLLWFVAVGVVTVPFAMNTGRAYDGAEALVLMWALVVGTVVLADSARRAELLILIYVLQFLVWGLLGGFRGRIGWHTVLSNTDAYGAFMVIGLGFCGYLVSATDGRRFRRAMRLAIGLCALGVVTSFARGAFLAAGVMGGLLWMRSSRKGHVVLAGLALAGVLGLLLAVSGLGTYYWGEMSTILQGTSENTGEDRMILWGAALRVFTHYPILGTGLRNWGVVASELFQTGELGGRYANNPISLYTRDLHSSYFQIISEQGLVGVSAFIWMIWDFWRRNMALRTAAADQLWSRMGGRLRLGSVALALEAGLVGWILSAALYSMAGAHWLYTILALNLALHKSLSLAGGRGAPKGTRERLRPYAQQGT